LTDLRGSDNGNVNFVIALQMDKVDWQALLMNDGGLENYLERSLLKPTRFLCLKH